LRAHANRRPPSSNLRGWRRPALIGVVGVVALALAVGWPARTQDPAPWQLVVLVAGLAGTGVWIRSSRRGDDVERLGPWLLLAVTAGAAVATGATAGGSHRLILLPLLYTATFFTRRRFALFALGTAAALGWVHVVNPTPAGLAELGVTALLWGSTAAFLHALVQRLDSAAQTDGLTGLWNHAAFWRRLQAEDARARRQQTPYSVLMIDVDHFKALNDKHGHQAGDAVLRRLADILDRRIRGMDVLARYGGEEFAVLLPDTAQDAAAQLAEKLRRLLAVAGISVSIGVADNADLQASPDEVVGAADAALYTAKLSGRARVCTAGAANVIDLPPAATAARRRTSSS
jgi:diguanylate cyclase (GGDEF)-like protein